VLPWFDHFLDSPQRADQVGFGLFSTQHLGMLGVLALFIVVVVWTYVRSTSQTRRVIRLGMGIIVLTMELAIRQAGFVVMGIYHADILPLHACAATTFCVFIDSIKPNSWCREFIYALGSWGALCALIFPDWTDQPLMNLFTWQSFLAHACLVAYALMILIAGEFRPSLKNLWKAVVIMVGFVIPSLIANHFWGTNFWFLSTAAPGSPLEPLQKMAGQFYIPVLGGALILLWGIMYLPWVRRTSQVAQGSTSVGE
jgi:hypothetical integral membrane protein (TIGR02206 family)